ncbi:MAG: tetratricopeptide repeat protein, partial [Gammaproteobacteria bacterium]
MADSKTAINEAKQRLRRGDKAGAARVLQSLIDAEPDNTHALVLLGILRERTGNAPAAEQYLSRVLASNSLPVSQRAEVLMHLGRVLNRLERRDEALTALAEAAQLQPDSVRPLRGLADALHGAHRAGEALEIYEKALTLDAADWRTLNNLALALLTLERPVDAERQLRAAVNAAPSEATCLNNLGEALLRQFKACEAVEVYDRARSMEPANPMALLGHARALAAAGQLPEAEEAASKLPPGLPFPGAETAYVSWQLQRFAACDWEDYDATLMRIRELTMTALDQATSAKAPDTARVPALKPLAALECYPEDTPLCNAIARAWSVATRDHVGHGETPQLPDTNGRIRIGYASPDFRVHPVAFLMRDLFAHHDKDRFEVFAYALRAPDDSGLVRSIREAADHFVDLSGDDDATAAERIRADRLHVLIDAAGYTAEARPAVLAARPAPIQVSYLGFFGSQQADWIDYLVANDTLVPASREKNYSETMVRIEPTPFAIDGFGDAPTGMTRSQAVLPDDAVVLC